MGPVAVYCLIAALDTGAVAQSPSPQGWDLPELTSKAYWGSSPNPEDVSCLRLLTQYTPTQASLQRSRRGRAPKQQDVTLDTGMSTLHRGVPTNKCQMMRHEASEERAPRYLDEQLYKHLGPEDGGHAAASPPELGVGLPCCPARSCHMSSAPPLSCDVPMHIPPTGRAPAVAAQQPQLECNDMSGDLRAPPIPGVVPEAGGPGQPPSVPDQGAALCLLTPQTVTGHRPSGHDPHSSSRRDPGPRTPVLYVLVTATSPPHPATPGASQTPERTRSGVVTTAPRFTGQILVPSSWKGVSSRGTVFTFPAASDGPAPHCPTISPSSPPLSPPAPHPSSSLRGDPGPFLGSPACPALVGVLNPPVQTGHEFRNLYFIFNCNTLCYKNLMATK
ncbi:hypothetical protein EI555_021118, partial [Monodon monoceros]